MGRFKPQTKKLYELTDCAVAGNGFKAMKCPKAMFVESEHTVKLKNHLGSIENVFLLPLLAHADVARCAQHQQNRKVIACT